MAEKDNRPPEWADQFLEWYCNPELVEEIQGDLYERFYERVDQRGLKRARRWYTLNVFLFMNKYTLRRKRSSYTRLNSLDMFRSYFKTGLRNALKHKWPTLINSAGLALAIGSTLVVYVFMEDTFYNDSMHENLEEIYVVEKTVQQDDGEKRYCSSPEPLGPELEANFPKIERTARFTHGGGTFRFKDQVFQEWVTFTDPAFFDIFSFPLLYGKAEDFGERNALFLSESLAAKYFGDKNPVGEELQIRFSRDGEEYTAGFEVRGVVEKLSMNSSFFFNILIPYDRQLELGRVSFTDWGEGTGATFVQIPAGTKLDEIENNLSPLISKANTDVTAWPVASFQFQPLSKIKRIGPLYEDNMFNSSHLVANIMLLAISGILILLVCFNYMNTTIATAVGRLKEISMRKVMGSNRKQLVMQFLAENAVVCFAGLLLGLLLAQTVFFDLVDNLINQPFIAALSFRLNLRFAAFLVFLLLLMIIGGSAYPAMYLSRLQPIDIMQDKVRMTSKNRFRKTLLGLQFMLTFVMIFTTVAFSGHMNKLKGLDWGYQPDATMVVHVDNEKEYDRFKQEISSFPEIRHVTGGKHAIGKSSEQVSVFSDGEKYDVEELIVGLDHFKAVGIPLASGRYPDSRTKTDGEKSIMINEQMRRKLGWDNAVGRTIKLDSQNYTVIGELANFRHRDFFQSIDPMVYRFCGEEEYRFMTLHLENADFSAINPKLDQAWKKTFPGQVFEYFYQDEVFREYFEGMNSVIGILTISSVIAIFISVIGLFGLVMLILASRMKEISIRRILGARLFDVGKLVNGEFFWPLMLAIVLGAPLAHFLVKSMLEQLSPENTEIGILPFVLTVLVILVLPLISASGHIYRATNKDPVVYLRKE